MKTTPPDDSTERVKTVQYAFQVNTNKNGTEPKLPNLLLPDSIKAALPLHSCPSQSSEWPTRLCMELRRDPLSFFPLLLLFLMRGLLVRLPLGLQVPLLATLPRPATATNCRRGTPWDLTGTHIGS
jgi:hypothetical protein